MSTDIDLLAPDIGARVQRAHLAVDGVAGQLRHAAEAEARERRDFWRREAAATIDLNAQLEVINATVSQYRSALSTFASRYPRAAPEQEDVTTSLSHPTVRNQAGVWMLRSAITEALRGGISRAEEQARTYTNTIFGSASMQRAKAEADTVMRNLNALEGAGRRLAATHDASIVAGASRRKADAEIAETRLRDLEKEMTDALRTLPPAMASWSAASWRSWSPVFDHSAVLMGFLRLAPDQLPGSDADFGAGVETPMFVSLRKGVLLHHRPSDRGIAHAMTRSIVLRALAARPAGKLRLSVFDPAGLGQSFSSLLELGEYNRDLIGGKVWSSSGDLHRLLGEHTAHIELVIQKYLRGEYETLDEFNAVAGGIAEPRRLLVVFDWPNGFDERSQNELRRVIENGPRCGVVTLLVADAGRELPHGLTLDFPSGSVRHIKVGAQFSEAGAEDGDGFSFELVPQLDTDAPSAVVHTILDAVGRAAQDATGSVVSFEKAFSSFVQAAVEGRKRDLPSMESVVDAEPSTWWSLSTLNGIAAPIGLRGARDVSTLAFDSSTRSGGLLVGRQGSGKSTLLHTFIAGITTLYSPSELELHLIDFKEGVEFKVYANHRLPHARTVAIESDREFGVSVLETIQGELTRRGSMLRGSDGSHSSLEAIRMATGERLPRILLLFDEFQVLFSRNDKLGARAAELLETIIRQGRGFGIHVLLGSQSLSGIEALGSHVPQLLPIRILLPATQGDAYKVLGDGNTEGTLLSAAGEGIINNAGGLIEANERFRGALISEESRRQRLSELRTKADAAGFRRRPVVFEGNAAIPFDAVPVAEYLDEIRGAEPRTLRLRFGVPMTLTGEADLNLRREAGANVLLVGRDIPLDGSGLVQFSLPRAVVSNFVLSAVSQQAHVRVVDFLPEEGIEAVVEPLTQISSLTISRRRQVPGLLHQLSEEVARRADNETTGEPPTLLVLYGMHRARDFDQESIDYDGDAGLSDVLLRILRDGPEVGVHTLIWFETLQGINRRLPAGGVREMSWRLAAKMSADDSVSLMGVETAESLRDQQVVLANEDRGLTRRCTVISEPTALQLQEVAAMLSSRLKRA